MQYEKQDLKRLHNVLIDIFEEIIRVCHTLNIPYFIQGGTAIGALFNQGIIPWDDDIDLGMLREDYDRFISEAPAIINPQFEIQCFEREPRSPQYWIKVMKKGTLFVQEEQKDIPVTKGIFVDIFPFDNVPDTLWKEKMQRFAIFIVDSIFTSKQRGRKYAEVRFLSLPKTLHTVIVHLLTLFTSMFSRRFLFYTLKRLQTRYNKKECKNVNIVLMPRDHIPMADIKNSVDMPFDRLIVKAPNNIETYLRHHYPWLTPIPPKEKQVNHRPLILDFGD